MLLLQDGRPLSFSVIQGQDQNSRLQLRQHMAFRQKIFDVNWQVFLKDEGFLSVIVLGQTFYYILIVK